MYFCQESARALEKTVYRFRGIARGRHQGAMIASAFKDECYAPLKENDFNAFVAA
jgi:hypothetical protein